MMIHYMDLQDELKEQKDKQKKLSSGITEVLQGNIDVIRQ